MMVMEFSPSSLVNVIVEQLPGGTISILLPAELKGTWNPTTMTFTSEDGENSITIIGIQPDDVTIGR